MGTDPDNPSTPTGEALPAQEVRSAAYPVDYDIAEMAEREQYGPPVSSASAGQPTGSERSGEESLWYTDKQGVRRQWSETSLAMAKALGYL